MYKLKYNRSFIGEKYGRLLILKDLGQVNGNRTVVAECECGVIKECRLSHLINNYVKSCGCLNKELIISRSTTHGQRQHPLYNVYNGMISRCYYKKDINYHNYGGRGITVCKEWLNDFKVFYDWAILNGWDKNLQLDKDKLAPNQRGVLYSPEFCCFITRKENLRYRRMTSMLEYNGETKPFMEWCEILNLTEKRVRNRINNMGWSVKDAFEISAKKPNVILYKNQQKTLREWCNELRIDVSAVSYRIRVLGWSYEKSFITPMRVLKNNKFPKPRNIELQT